jgi:hypothetical protein
MLPPGTVTQNSHVVPTDVHLGDARGGGGAHTREHAEQLLNVHANELGFREHDAGDVLLRSSRGCQAWRELERCVSSIAVAFGTLQRSPFDRELWSRERRGSVYSGVVGARCSTARCWHQSPVALTSPHTRLHHARRSMRCRVMVGWCVINTVNSWMNDLEIDRKVL